MKATLYRMDGPWPSRLAIVPRPRGGDWLADEVRAWRSAGVNLVVSTLTPEEIAEFDLSKEEELCVASGIEYVSFPIEDRGVPSSPALAAELVRRLEGALSGGHCVAIHCRAGIGRSALLSACVLVSSGLDPDLAFIRIGDARGCSVPDTLEQQNGSRSSLGRLLS